jgi:hypothetical protein
MNNSIKTAENHETVNAGDYQTAVAGHYGTAITGLCGVSVAGVGGRAAAGQFGVIVIKYNPNNGFQYRIKSGNIGENGLKPNTLYELNSDYEFTPVTENAGDHQEVKVGDYMTAVAGDASLAEAGESGTAVTGDWGRSITGCGGHSKAGRYGLAESGNYGISEVGCNGHARSGYDGWIYIQYWDAATDSYKVKKSGVGIGGVTPYTFYKLDENNEFVPVEEEEE